MARAKNGVKGLISQFSGGESDVKPAPVLSQEAKDRRELDLVVGVLLRKTSARRIGTTYGIQIVANSHDPELAAGIANAISEQYLVEQLDSKFEQIKTRNSWLEVRLAELKAEVAENERTVEIHRAAHGLISSGTSTLNEQQIRDINQVLKH